ncbi:hypothetical protein [Humidisolicoccus flavus]|uniref:hypothetical protein n=1 Tax=Humidisolicoccus flavus TaxID=3111414 RepID=UPI00324851EF
MGDQPEPVTKQHALVDEEQVRRAARLTPWPLWLYFVNALLITGLALTPLLGEMSLQGWLAIGFALTVANAISTYRSGVPWALPMSRVFLGALAVATALVVAALIAGMVGEERWPVVVCALAAGVVFALGSAAHIRRAKR